MNQRWTVELLNISLWLVLGLAVGGFFGHALVGLVAALAYLLLRQYYHLFKMDLWLQSQRLSETPDLPAVCGHITDQVYRLIRRNRRRKQRLAHMLKRFQQSTQAMPDATIVLNDNGEIEWINRAAQQTLGLKGSDTGQRIHNLIRHPAFVQFLDTATEADHLNLPSPVNDRIALDFRIIPYGKGQRLLIARDVTQLQRVQEMRQDFVANVSHELRTPLTVVAGYVETLMDMEDAVDPGTHKILGQMHSQTERMRRIVEDLLLLSRLETTRLDPAGLEPVHVPAMLASIEEDARILSGEEEHHIRLEVEPGLMFNGVPKELHSAFSNLVFNAVKYTPQGGTITIRWYSRGTDKVFEVEDSGIGIDQKHIPRLTERFYRVDVGRSRERGGTGLGLAIVKHVLLRHGGELQIESEPGRGSVFRCVFPQAKLLTAV